MLRFAAGYVRAGNMEQADVKTQRVSGMGKKAAVQSARKGKGKITARSDAAKRLFQC